MEHQKQNPTILVVDDSETVANTLAMVLRHSGYTVVVAYNSKQALEVASTGIVDLAAIDVNLPGMDGVQTAVEVCKRLPGCKILLISGATTTAEILERAKADGIEFPILPKPIPPAVLLSTIRDLLTGKEDRT